ncbi:MAG: (2Fe-2S)-binding protein [Alphaproteobacteria bacterium]|nr:(2Fe-2S)-binding protein [Alphaproteobacteria bacterium]
MVAITINGERRDVAAEPDKPLLWVLREDLALVGTKFGCGVAACGACTVHVDGQAMRSCSVLLEQVAGREVVTIEGLGGERLHAVQMAWIELQVPQCGYCQPGFMMATAALLKEKPKPTDAEIDAALTNICRCGTYQSIRKAVHRAAALTEARR